MAYSPTVIAKPADISPVWVPITTYAKHYHIGESTVRKWVRLGWIEHIRLGKSHRVNLYSVPGGAAA